MSQTRYKFDPKDHKHQLIPILTSLQKADRPSENDLVKLLKQHPKDGQGYFSKSQLISGFRHFRHQFKWKINEIDFINQLKKKPTRTQSGVTPVTVLTKPFPCPGKCIFCPNDVRMPKSYLSDEPGAQRAAKNAFDPYLQTFNRLDTFNKNGHNTQKIELIILGGTWSFYPEPYQIWFVKRCFDALNDFSQGMDNRNLVKKASDFTKLKTTVDGSKLDSTYNQIVSKELAKTQQNKLLNSWETATWGQLRNSQLKNESSICRNVGLVIETRPDKISQDEVIRIRKLGCTKTQIGFQSLNDSVLKKNNRGHDVAATIRAIKLLRLAGFKIHAHWMANLYGSSPQKDIADFNKLFKNPAFRPDELKIYPCSLIKTAELMKYYQKNLWQPYTHEQLLFVLTHALKTTPKYCRLTRVIRDIPSPDIVAGNKKTNFRQIAQTQLDSDKIATKEIRNREIKSTKFDPLKLKLDISSYKTSVSSEKFLQFITPKNHIVAFLRLSLPHTQSFIAEIKRSALIREIHVYGTAVNLGQRSSTKAQHLGLGTKLFAKAVKISKSKKFSDLAVISAVGTRHYYRKLGFTDGILYQHFNLLQDHSML